MRRSFSNLLRENQFRVSAKGEIYCVHQWRRHRCRVMGEVVERSMTVMIQLYDPATRQLSKRLTVDGEWVKGCRIISNGSKAGGLQAAHREHIYQQTLGG